MNRLFRVFLICCLCVPTAITPVSIQAAPQYNGDALIPPALSANRSSSSVQADSNDPSAFLAGKIAVQLIFVESDGSVEPSSEDWTDAQRAQVATQIQSSLDWWDARVPNAQVQFSLFAQTITTGYEPISHNLSGERLWAGEVLGKLGFSANTYFDQAYQADEALRQKQQTDWATTIFVVNSAHDNDGAFSDGRFGYAYVNGPFLVVTSTAGAYGTNQLAPVVAHELGHIFGALDQYAAAGTPCTMTSGYLAVATSNSQANNCGTHDPSIMLEPISAFLNGAVDQSALGQLGYHDSDGDDIPDPLDTAPTLITTFTPGNLGERPIFVARATDQPWPAPQHRTLTINTITSIEMQIDDGEWLPLPPADGAFDSADELVLTRLPVYDGEHIMKVRATNRLGISSNIQTQHMTISGVGSAPNYSIQIPTLTNLASIPVHIMAPTGYQLRVATAPALEQVPWQNLDENIHVPLPTSDGTYTVYAQLRDGKGLETPLFSATTTLDQTPPIGQAVLIGGTTPVLRISAEDALSGVTSMQMTATNVSEAWQAYSTELALSDGIIPTAIRFRDAAGNNSQLIIVQQIDHIFLPLVSHP